MLKFRNDTAQTIYLKEPTLSHILRQDISLQEPVWNNLHIYHGSSTILSHLCQSLQLTVPKSECWQNVTRWLEQLSDLVSGLQSHPKLLEALDLERYGFTAYETLEVLQDIKTLCHLAQETQATEVRMDLNDLGDLDSEI